MNEAKYKRLSLLIKKYCPEFTVDQYPGFIDFIKTYYDWSLNEAEYNPWHILTNIVNWSDIDTTLDEFINYFKIMYLDNLSANFNGDISTFIKHSKEFYASRGTPESFRYLLRLLSGGENNIFYPNQFLMKSSDGKWVHDYVLFIEHQSSLDQSFISTRLTGVISGATGVIEDIEIHIDPATGNQFMKIYISAVSGTFVDEDIQFSNGIKTITSHNYITINKVNIDNSGLNYNIGDKIYIPTNPTFAAEVSRIKIGRVDSYIIYDGGSNYQIGDEIFTKNENTDSYWAYPKLFVNTIDNNGAITSIEIRYGGYGFLKVPEIDYISSSTGSGADISLISNDSGSISEIRIINASINYSSTDSLVILSDTGIDGELSLSTSYMYTSEGYYAINGSFLSDDFKLQDSNYWQEYSYEIQSDLDLGSEIINLFSTFKDVFKKLVHPAGFKLFNSFVLSNHIDMKTLYIDSIIEISEPDIELDIFSWIEMISYWNRIVDHSRIFEYRLKTINSQSSNKIEDYTSEGGEYIRNDLELES